MKRLSLVRGMVMACLSSGVLMGAEPEVFQPLFNGRDLSGWTPVNVAPGTFTARDGQIISTGKPTGILRTDRQYENFVLELEWKHLHAKGNAGVFVWSEPMTARGTPFAKSIEVQVLDVAAGDPGGRYTGHGDVFAIHGARMTPDRPHPGGWERCLPSELRAKPAGEWNHYRIEARDGVLKLAVNGKVVSGGSGCTPRKGYICLESERSECHFRNLRIRELPSSQLSPADIASTALDWTSLYTGVDLSGWKLAPGDEKHWAARDWVLWCDGDAASPLMSEKTWRKFELQLDWRLANKTSGAPSVVFGRGAGTKRLTLALPPGSKGAEAAGWNRTLIRLEGGVLAVAHNGQETERLDWADAAAEGSPIGLAGGGGGPVEFANVFARRLEQ